MTLRMIGISLLIGLCLVTPVRAQDGALKEGRLRLSGSFAGTAGDLGSEAAYGASLGYRFSRRFSIELELTGIPNASGSLGRPRWFDDLGVTTPLVVPSRGAMPGAGRDPVRGNVPGPFPTPVVIGFGRAESDALLGTANLRTEFRADNERVRPYLTGGFGLAHVETEFEVVGTYTPSTEPGQRQRQSPAFMFPPEGTGGVPIPIGRADGGTRTDLALVLGGGLSVRLVKGLFVDADVRYFRLLDPGRNVGRFGGGLSYRF
jgi:opacity protein-like surface antigen